MKITRSMVGIEGLLTAPPTSHAEAGASKVSFAESLRENLTAPVMPDRVEPAATPDKRRLEFETADKETEGHATKTSAHLSGFIEVSNASAGGVSAGDSAATAEVSDGLLQSTVLISPLDLQKGPAPGIPQAELSALPAEQQKFIPNPATELAGKGEEASTAMKRPIGEQPDVVRADVKRETNGGVKVSGTTGAKGKPSEALSRRKQKHVLEDVVTGAQAPQHDQRIETAGMLQSTAAANTQVASIASSQAVPHEAAPLSSSALEETAGPGGKLAGVHALRRRQSDQTDAKSADIRRAISSAVADKAGEPVSPEEKPAVDATAKFSKVEHGSTPKEDGPGATQLLPQSETASTVLPAQAHARAMVTAGDLTETTPAHTEFTPQATAVSSHTIYAPGDHGTIAATPTALEVGLPGGSHGWLKVRAELGGDGSVHASMSTNSAAGNEILRRELPQLTSYLHQEQIRVNSVVVHAPQASTDFSNQPSNEGQRQAMNGGSQDSHRGDAGARDSGPSHSQARTMQTAPVLDVEGDLLLSGGLGAAGGWLSVRA